MTEGLLVWLEKIATQIRGHVELTGLLPSVNCYIELLFRRYTTKNRNRISRRFLLFIYHRLPVHPLLGKMGFRAKHLHVFFSFLLSY